jgi:ABC-type hemin transport system ATPase subunit
VWTALADGSTRHLLLDEPTSSLDLAHQSRLLSRAKTFAREGGAVLAILHDLNLAAAFADRILVMNRGRIIAVGGPREVLTAALIREVWQVEPSWRASRSPSSSGTARARTNKANCCERPNSAGQVALRSKRASKRTVSPSWA